ncbi:Uncharacterized protein M6B38_112570 [Iris pallida]|uniref:RING-type domain-containing protein n=1 Tax=Iris pallida TaxID=29817 RepID=A0AAX6DMZ0_IRIPA|nr:Uncharacterized protein M6B38_112570 [Iris pallida]
MAELRQKRDEEDVSDDRDFQRELEELMNDQLLRRRRRSSLGGDDTAESSAAARRHSRILSRWVARHTTEMLTTIERRNRESELTALAGLHTVSMRRADLSESDCGSTRSSRENSPDLGDDRERVREMVNRISETAREPRNESPRSEWMGENERERVRSVREWVRMASERRGGRGDDGSVTDDHEEDGPPEHVRRDMLRIRGRQARLDLIMRMARERERELRGLEEHRAVSEFPHRNRIQALLRGRFLRNERPAEEERPPSMAARELGLLRQRHSVSGLREGFRFRLENIVRSQASNHSDSLVNQNVSSARNDLSQPSTAVEPSTVVDEQPPSRSDSSDVHQNTESHTTADVESNRRDDVIARQESVTQSDNLQEEGSEHGRIDSQQSSEIGRREWQPSATQGEYLQEEDAEHGRGDWQQSTEVGFGDWHDEIGEEYGGNWEENIDQAWPRQIAEDEDGEDGHFPEGQEWHENDSHENLENWQEGPSDASSGLHSFPNRRVNRFIPPDDENVYSMELRELLSRRSVSNLLSSGFRESLDQLIQSYVQRQVHSPLDWDIQGSLPTPASPEEDLNRQADVQNPDQQDSVTRPPLVNLVIPPPPVPPRQPLSYSDLHHSNWSRQSMHHSEIEWDIINDLRADMNRLQQGMGHMQRMLEACMDMQLELQRSVRQEVSAALNRSLEEHVMVENISDDGSKWSQVRKGNCCICCDSHIDALLYRCGHMCTCSKCAHELVRSGGKCPLCRAPIIEVIKAYSIL